ncbi:hypothetical protein PRIPAC_83919 [Pristionchus pacificus]|nr:hypothetical protein PRIPAC_83919 [Pristionchus pacificus]|eukprot:PDM66317.1 hypothetical protein PRIPAC_47734 [Pristionchus pacificus]
MVFESLVADLLNRFLGDFVDNLDSSQLNIGIWGGDVKLENLEIKESALDDLDLPAKKNAKEIKEKTLTRLEEARKNRRKPPDPQADSFAEKMVAQVIKNLQVAVHNVHVRFEDKYTNRSRPFAAGVTLAALQLDTTDSNWKKTIHKDAVKIVHKLVELNSLAVYWDSDVKLISDLTDKMKIRHLLREFIAAGEHRPKTKYILEPIRMQAKLSLNQKPETDESNWKIPKIDLVVDMDQLTMAIGKMQYQDLLLFLEAQERFGLATQYLKHRPNLNEYKGHYKEWWLFAYKSILHEKVKRRRENWNWSRMKKHRDLVKAYTEAWVSKQTEKSPAASVTKMITDGEEKLDVFNVNVARQQAEMEIDRRGLTRLDDQPQGWMGWAKSWWGGSAEGAPPAKPPPGKGGDIATKFQAAMTPEEKAKLFEAIDYEENMPPTNYPKEFVENRIDFKLGQVNIIVEGAIKMDFVGLHAALLQRPSAGAINLKARISEVRMDGCKEAMLRMREKGDWLTVEVDTNPLAGGYDQKVALRIAPVNVIYHAAAVNKAIDVFKPPESVKLNQLTAAAMSRYEEVKTRSTMGMQHALEKKTKLVLDMVIQPATIFICEGGTYAEFKPVLLADLGLLTISTVDVDVKKLTEKDRMGQLAAKAYDRFRVELSNVVVVLAENVKDAEAARTQPSSPLHLLRPTGLDIQIHKCGIDDLKLAKLRILGNLPDVVIGISDVHLIMLLKLLISIPKPPADAVTEKEEELVSAPKLRDRAKMKTIMEDEVELSVEPTDEPKDVLAKNNQQVQIELELSLNEVGLVVSRGSSTLVALSVLGMKCRLQMRTHDMVVKAEMGALRVHMPTHKSLAPGRDHLYLVDNLDQDGPLLSVDYVQAQTESPFFATEYKNTEQHVRLNFTQLIVSLHQEGLIELKKYGEEVQAKVNEIVGKKDDDSEVEGTEETVTDAVGKKLSQVVAHSMESLTALRKEHSARKKSRKDTMAADVETDKIINMKVESRFGSLSVYLGSEKQLESMLSIEDKRLKSILLAKKIDYRVSQRDNLLKFVSQLHWCMGADRFKGFVSYDFYKGGFTTTKPAPFESPKDYMFGSGSMAACDNCSSLSCTKCPRCEKPHCFDFQSGFGLPYGVRASVKMMKAQMDVSATLKSIAITDSAKDALYRKLMHVQGKEEVMLRFEMTQFNREEKAKRPTDIDMRVKVRIARLRFVFVNLWVSRVLAWLQPFQAQAAAAAAAASAAATAKAQQVAQDVKAAIAERQPRIELDVHLEAPIILVPRLSTSNDVIVVDLGSMSVNNKIVAEKAGGGMVVIDAMAVTLKECSVGVGTMEGAGRTLVNRRHILSPLTFTVQLSRNLMWEESKAKPQAAVDMHLSVVEAKLSQKDYATIMATLSGNLAEKVEPDDTVEVFTPPSTRTPPIEDLKKDEKKTEVEKQHPGDRIADAATEEKPVVATTDVQFDVRLVVDEIKAVLNADDDGGIATLSIRGFKTNAKVLGDGSLDVALNLTAFTMYDERAETEIRELMEKRGHKDEDLIKMHFAQNAQQDRKVRLSMCAFFICLCPEFLGSLAKFFAVEKTEEEKEREAAEAERSVKREGVYSISRPCSKLASGATTVGVAGGGAAGGAAAPAAPVQGTLALDADIKGIEVILVEDSTQPASSQALILTFNCNIKSHPTADAEEMTGGIEGLHIFSSYYDVTKRDQVTYEVLKKADIKLTLRSERKSKAMDIKVHSTPLELYMAPSIIRMLSAVNTQFAAASQEESTVSTLVPRVRTFENYWGVKPLNEAKHWFLKVPVAEEAVEEVEEQPVSPTGPVERAEVKFPVISLTLETDDGGVRTPLILLGMSMELNASNWSWALKAEGDISLQMNYYNESISVWEPVIEPCEVDEGVFETWTMQLNVIGRNKLDSADKNPDMSVKIETERMLNITFTKSLYELTNKLGDAFTRAAKQIAPPTGTQLPGDEPFLVLNDTGVTVMIHNSNTLQVSSDDRPIDATHGDYVRLRLREEVANGVGSAAAAARDPFGPPVQQETKIDMIPHDGRSDWCTSQLSWSADERPWCRVVAETRVEGGRRLLTLSSHIRVQSHIETDIEVFTRRDTTLDPAGTVSFGEKMNMPINLLYGNEGEIFFKPTADKWSVCETGVRWHDFSSTYRRMVECRSVENPTEAFHFEVTITEERCQYGNDHVHAYVVHFHPPLVLQNLLPMPINVKKPLDLELEPGDHSVINVVPGEVLKLSVVHLGEVYWLDMPQEEDKPDLQVIALNLDTGADELLLGIRWSRESGGMRASLYAPFWLVNNTLHTLNHLVRLIFDLWSLVTLSNF